MSKKTLILLVAIGFLSFKTNVSNQQLVNHIEDHSIAFKNLNSSDINELTSLEKIFKTKTISIENPLQIISAFIDNITIENSIFSNTTSNFKSESSFKDNQDLPLTGKTTYITNIGLLIK